MKSYQVYCVDADGTISGNRSIEAMNDEAVIFEVRAMERPLDTEIWDRDRRIARIPARRAEPDR